MSAPVVERPAEDVSPEEELALAAGVSSTSIASRAHQIYESFKDDWFDAEPTDSLADRIKWEKSAARRQAADELRLALEQEHAALEQEHPVLHALLTAGALEQSQFTSKSAGSLGAAELAPAVAVVLSSDPALRLSYSASLDARSSVWGWLVGSELKRPADQSLLISKFLYPALKRVHKELFDADPFGELTDDHLSTGLNRFACSGWIQSQSWNGFRGLFGALKDEPALAASLKARESAFARWLLTLPAEDVDRPLLWAAYVDAGLPGGLRGGRNASVPELSNVLLALNGGARLKRSDNSERVPLGDVDFRERAVSLSKGGE